MEKSATVKQQVRIFKEALLTTDFKPSFQQADRDKMAYMNSCWKLSTVVMWLRFTESVSLYSSKTLIARVTKRHRQEEIAVARSSKQLRSDDSVSKTGAQFNFKMHCLFCINVIPCVLPSEYSRKIPHARRIPAYSVCTDVNQHGEEYTKVLLAKCSERNDKCEEVVRCRIVISWC